MSSMDQFGQRIQALRKARGMTQEELASRLGLSAQAVSKWEMGLSYPDITLLPTLADIFSVSMNHLFGTEDRDSPVLAALPGTLEGLPLVHQHRNIGCYAGKAVLRTDGSSVRFADGSIAELSNRLITNRGPGDIRLLSLEEAEHLSGTEVAAASQAYAFGPTDALRVQVWANDTEVARSPDDKTRVTVTGHPRFLRQLTAAVEEGALVIRFRKAEEDRPCGRDNRVRIEVPYARGRLLEVSVIGSGDLACPLPFAEGSLTVNGSGNLHAGDMDRLVAQINGSGSVHAGSAQAATLSINGSGDIRGKQAASLSAQINGSGNIALEAIGGGEVTARIGGSGSIALRSGTCTRLDFRSQGHGSLRAKGVTAQTASIILDNSGEAVLGRVLEASTEQAKKSGKITILARGPVEDPA